MPSVLFKTLKTGEERFYNIRNPDISMARLFRQHCHFCGVRATSMRFLDGEGQRIKDGMTYANLAEDVVLEKKTNILLVQIDMMQEQTGGRGRIYWR